ncbi:MAG: WD40 repeat domain-containing protein [Planctomycetaceae bacterium]
MKRIVLIVLGLFVGLVEHQPTVRAQQAEKLRHRDADPVIAIFKGHEEYVYSLSYSADRRTLATGAGDNTAIIWDLENRKPKHVLQHDSAVYVAAVSPDGKLVATATGKGMISIWNANNGQRLLQKKGHKDAAYCAAFSPDGKRLASAGGSTDGGDTTCRIWQVEGLKLQSELKGHKRQVYGLSFSPDGKSIATASSDKSIRLWDLKTQKHRSLAGHSSDVYRVHFSPNGKQLASVGQDGRLLLHTLDSQHKVRELFRTRRKEPLYGVRFSPDGKLLGGVGDDYRLRIWRLENEKQLLEHKVARKSLYTIAFGPKLGQVMVTSEDGVLYLLQIPNLQYRTKPRGSAKARGRRTRCPSF